jgi:hypothetical protein
MKIILCKPNDGSLERQHEPKEGEWVVATAMQLYKAILEGKVRGYEESLKELRKIKLSMLGLYYQARVRASQENNLPEFDTQEALLLPVQVLKIEEGKDYLSIGIPPYYSFAVPRDHYRVWWGQSRVCKEQLACHMNQWKEIPALYLFK